ncbi:hypothetical protein Fmac_020865 [Flemingia macrophylla]|uniref:Uncharacterized protein n=1 Tax=Flemingia macrophylla TaxID=520843 RepID=A0ABD1LVS4_9FABA
MPRKPRKVKWKPLESTWSPWGWSHLHFTSFLSFIRSPEQNGVSTAAPPFTCPARRRP